MAEMKGTVGPVLINNCKLQVRVEHAKSERNHVLCITHTHICVHNNTIIKIHNLPSTRKHNDFKQLKPVLWYVTKMLQIYVYDVEEVEVLQCKG